MPQQTTPRRTEFDEAKDAVGELITQYKQRYSPYIGGGVGLMDTSKDPLLTGIVAECLTCLAGTWESAKHSLTQNPKYQRAVEFLLGHEKQSEEARDLLQKVYDLIPEFIIKETTSRDG